MSFLFATPQTPVPQTTSTGTTNGFLAKSDGNANIPLSNALSECKSRSDYVKLLSKFPQGYLEENPFDAAKIYQALPFAMPSMVSNRLSGRGRGRNGKGKVRLVKAGKDGTTYATNEMAAPYTKLPRNIGNQDYRIVQSVDYNTGLSNTPLVTSSTSAATYAAKYFTIGDLDQSSTLAAFFDQYRIDLIEVWIECATPGTYNTHFVSVIDFDDANVLTTYPSAADYQNAVDTSINISHYRSFVPHIAVASYSGSFVSYANVVAPWIDYASTSVQHYGIKVAVATTVAVQTFNIRARFHVSNRNVR